MDPLRTSRLGIDAAIVVAINAVIVVVIASARLLDPAIAIAASLVALGVATVVIQRLRRDRLELEAVARSLGCSCDTAPRDGAGGLGHR
jgi:hypothetical protein